MSLLDPIVASLRTRLTRLERSHPRPREGRVTQSYPMQVRLDGDTVDTPVRQIAAASVGSRVLCMKLGFRYYMIGQVGGQGAMLLDEISMTGPNRDPIRQVTIPQHLQGQFARYTLYIKAGLRGGNDTRPLVVRINGDGGTNYRAMCAGMDGSTQIAHTNSTSTAFPRTGYTGDWEGHLRIDYIPRDWPGPTRAVHWETTGWAQNSNGNNYAVSGGGVWAPSGSHQITHMIIMCSTISEEWNVYSTAQLWGHR